jgi:hypothetical protein
MSRTAISSKFDQRIDIKDSTNRKKGIEGGDYGCWEACEEALGAKS